MRRAPTLFRRLAGRPLSRAWSAVRGSQMPRVPLNQPLLNLPPAPRESYHGAGETRVTTLPSGLRVASHETYTPIMNLGVFINAGSRYESDATRGVSYFMEHMAFKSTKRRSDYELVRTLSAIGANVSSSSSREAIIFSGELLREHAPVLIDVFADLAFQHPFREDELRQVIADYKEQAKTRDKQHEAVMMEGVHAAAYGAHSLGRSLFPDTAHADQITSARLHEYARQWYTPDRMVVAAVGIEHYALVDLVMKHMEPLAQARREAGGGAGQKGSIGAAPGARYTGGEWRRVDAEWDEKKHVHAVLAFETASWHSADLVPMCVLQMLLGGGGSFSSGGPGKGMFSRLYERCLMVCPWVNSSTSFNSINSDSSLFGIYATCEPHRAKSLLAVTARQFLEMLGEIGDEELARARNQLKSSVFMQLESRPLLLEDIGRQLLVYNRVQSPHAIGAQIDRVTTADLHRVAREMMRSKLSLAVAGDLSWMPSYAEVAASFGQGSGEHA